MATKLYLESTAFTLTAPALQGSWSITNQYATFWCGTTRGGSTMTTRSATSAVSTAQQVILAQFVSHPLTVNQTINGGQAISCQMRCSETDTSNNLFLTWGVYVMNGDTLQKT